MKTIRFFVCNDGVIRTTATEIGNWLLAKQAKIKPLKDGFYHFGTQFNGKLCTTIKQLNRSGAGTDALLSTSDFMKLDDTHLTSLIGLPERYFADEHEFKADILKPQPVDFTPLCNEIFADG